MQSSFQIRVGLSVFVVKVRARTSTPIDNRPCVSTPDLYPTNNGMHCAKMNDIWRCQPVVRDNRVFGCRGIETSCVALLHSSEEIGSASVGP
jgi:hypothetical protein